MCVNVDFYTEEHRSDAKGMVDLLEGDQESVSLSKMNSGTRWDS